MNTRLLLPLALTAALLACGGEEEGSKDPERTPSPTSTAASASQSDMTDAAAVTPSPLAGWTCEMFDPGYETPGIYIYDTETCRVTRATTGPSDGLGLSWSPDGTKIAFTRYDPENLGVRPANSDIFVLDLQSGLETRMTNTPSEHESGAQWSHDGSLLIFGTVPLDQLQNLDRRYVIKAVTVNQPGDVRTLVDDTCFSAVSWSPVRAEFAVANCREITVIDGSGQIVTRVGREVGWGVPVWSPDGSRFLLSCYLPPSISRTTICVVPRDGSAVITMQVDSVYFSWMHDGNISFTSSGNLYIADASTGQTTRVIEGWRGETIHWVSTDRAASVTCLPTDEVVVPCPSAWSLIDPNTLGTAYLMPIGCGSGSSWSRDGRYLALAFGAYPVGCG